MVRFRLDAGSQSLNASMLRWLWEKKEKKKKPLRITFTKKNHYVLHLRSDEIQNTTRHNPNAIFKRHVPRQEFFSTVARWHEEAAALTL